MSGVDDLRRLSFSAVWSPPHDPFGPAADCITAIPKLRRHSLIRRVFNHSYFFTILNFPSDFSSELKVKAAVVDTPRPIGRHKDSFFRIADKSV